MEWFFIGLVVVVIGYGVLTYNSLISKRNKVKNSWSQIEVQLKRRFDLIPNLVETVKGYASHERETFQKVTEARSKFMGGQSQKETMESAGEVSQLLGRLFAVAENYPQLKADTNFMQLQQELSRTEDKIGFSRQFYNDVVLDLNNKIHMFPSNIIAKMFGFEEAAFMETEQAQREAVNVRF